MSVIPFLVWTLVWLSGWHLLCQSCSVEFFLQVSFGKSIFPLLDRSLAWLSLQLRPLDVFPFFKTFVFLLFFDLCAFFPLASFVFLCFPLASFFPFFSFASSFLEPFSPLPVNAFWTSMSVAGSVSGKSCVSPARMGKDNGSTNIYFRKWFLEALPAGIVVWESDLSESQRPTLNQFSWNIHRSYDMFHFVSCIKPPTLLETTVFQSKPSGLLPLI